MWHSLFPSQNDLREITRTCIILGHLLNISAYQGTDSCVCMGVRCKDDYTMFLLSVLPWNKFQPFKITKGRNLNHLTVSSSCLGCSRLTVSACWVNAWNGHSVVQHWYKLKASPSTQMHGARLQLSPWQGLTLTSRGQQTFAFARYRCESVSSPIWRLTSDPPFLFDALVC